MAPQTQYLTDLQTGRYSYPWVNSLSYGPFLAPMIQTINIAPKLTVESDGQWGTVPNVISVQTYEGSQGTIDWKYSNLQVMEMMLGNILPQTGGTQTDPISLSPGYLYPIDLWYNDKGKNQNKQYGSRLLLNGNLTALGSNGDLNSSRKESAAGMFLMEYRIKGGIIQYSRFVDSPAYTSPYDIAFSTGAGTFATTAVKLNNVSGNFVLGAKWTTGGVATWFVDPSVFAATWTVTATTFTPTVAPVSGDVWEVWTVTVPA